MNDKQITETYAVKLDSEVKEELQELIKQNSGGGTQGDFIRLLVETFKSNKLSDTIVDTKAELRELNSLTTRIYAIYSNLIEKNNSTIEGVKADVAVSMEIKDNEIIKLKDKVEELKQSNDFKLEELIAVRESNEKLLSELEQLREINSKNSMLIEKLNEEVEECKSIKSEFKELEKLLDFLTNTNKELQDIISSNDTEISNLTEKLDERTAKYKEDLEDEKLKSKEKMESTRLEHQRDLDNLKHSLESRNTEQVFKLKEEHQNEIKNIQDKNFEDREKLQDKYSKHLDQAYKDKEDLQKDIQELKEQLSSKTNKDK